MSQIKLSRLATKTVARLLVFTFVFSNSVTYPISSIPSLHPSPIEEKLSLTRQGAALTAPGVRSELRKLLGIDSSELAIKRSELRN